MSSSSPVDACLPLTEVTYFILLSLAPGSRHGYAILKSVNLLSQGRVTLSTGTLYGALKRMLEQGWIVPAENGTVHSGRVRKAYLLSSMGRRLLNAEMQRLEVLLSAARAQAFQEAS